MFIQHYVGTRNLATANRSCFGGSVCGCDVFIYVHVHKRRYKMQIQNTSGLYIDSSSCLLSTNFNGSWTV